LFATWPIDRSAPQPPQFWLSNEVFTQPPLHSVVVAPEHAKLHVPIAQVRVAVPKRGPGQTWPQLPQLSGSPSVATQLVPHLTNPLLQASWQTPAAQLGVA
jgi:hypothetical protein